MCVSIRQCVCTSIFVDLANYYVMYIGTGRERERTERGQYNFQIHKHFPPLVCKYLIQHPLSRRVVPGTEQKCTPTGHVFQSDCKWVEPRPLLPRHREPKFEDLKEGCMVLALAHRNVLSEDNRAFRIVKRVDSRMIYLCRVEKVYPATRRIQWRYMCLRNQAYTNKDMRYIAIRKAGKAKSWFIGDALDSVFDPSEILSYWYPLSGCEHILPKKAIPSGKFLQVQRLLCKPRYSN
jgi:hypothetical protein